MNLSFSGSTESGKIIKSNSIIQKMMPDGLHILLRQDGKWLRISNISFQVECDEFEKAYKRGFMAGEEFGINESKRRYH